MQRGTTSTSSIRRPKRQIRFPGLCTAAYDLKVHRNHLYLVLSGKRVSKRLMKKYQAWKAQNDALAMEQPKEATV